MQSVCSRAWDLRVQDILVAIATIQRHIANIAFAWRATQNLIETQQTI